MITEGIILGALMYFYKKKKNKEKNKEKSKNRRKGGNPNSRQKRKQRKETISETQRLSIVNAVINKKRLLVYTDSL